VTRRNRGLSLSRPAALLAIRLRNPGLGVTRRRRGLLEQRPPQVLHPPLATEGPDDQRPDVKMDIESGPSQAITAGHDDDIAARAIEPHRPGQGFIRLDSRDTNLCFGSGQIFFICRNRHGHEFASRAKAVNPPRTNIGPCPA